MQETQRWPRIARQVWNAFSRVRRVPLRWLSAFSLVLSIIVVLGTLSERKEGFRTATGAYLPLRQPTPAEAVVLMEEGRGASYPQSAIIGDEGRDILIASRIYLVPRARDDVSHDEWIDGEARNTGYRVSSATWENFYSLYRVSRREFESALGRQLQPSDFTRPEFVDEYTVSFDPRHVPRYVAIEVAFLTIWFALLSCVALRVRRPTALLPILVPVFLLPILFVRFYSPAFYDADWFYQRIVLENIALLSAGVLVLLLLPAVLSTVVFLSLQTAETLARGRGVSPTRYRHRAISMLLALSAVLLLWQYVRFLKEAEACRADLNTIRGRVEQSEWVDVLLSPTAGLPRATNLMKEGMSEPEVQLAVAAILEPSGDRATHGVVVLTPAMGAAGEHLLMWRNGFLYADFRELQDGFRSLIDASALSEIQQRESWSTGFLRGLNGGHICGETLDVGDRSVLIAVKAPFRVGWF